MKTRIKPPLRLISAVQIKGVRLVEATAKTRIGSPQEAGEVEFAIHYSARVKEHRKDSTFVVLSTVEARLTPREPNARPAVSVRAGFELTYSLPEDFPVSSSQLNAFAQTNGIFNVWPYWREFIQSMFVRMGLPPLALPVYRLPEPRKGVTRGRPSTKAPSSTVPVRGQPSESVSR